MDGYSWYKKNEKKYITDNKNLIESCKNEAVPQHILWSKAVADELIKGENGYLKSGAGFFFTEKLVNRLMWFSHKKGSVEIDKKSFAFGWDECIKEITKTIEQLNPPANKDETNNVIQQTKGKIK